VEVGWHKYGFYCGFTPDCQKEGFYLGYSGPIDRDGSFHRSAHHLLRPRLCRTLCWSNCAPARDSLDHCFWSRYSICGSFLGTITWIFGNQIDS
jgi:hypothetical protein